jgi:hypothetical protein
MKGAHFAPCGPWQCRETEREAERRRETLSTASAHWQLLLKAAVMVPVLVSDSESKSQHQGCMIMGPVSALPWAGRGLSSGCQCTSLATPSRPTPTAVAP